MRVPDSPAPVLGYRAWAVRETRNGLRLRSLWFPTGSEWPPFRRAEARCCAPTLPLVRHRAPRPGHTCGLYAMKSVDDVREWTLDHAPTGGRPIVAGGVWCWGTVVEGERGYRAQYAYPASFLPLGLGAAAEEAGRAGALARIYGVASG